MNKTSKTTLVVERVLDAPAEQIYKALTEESQLRQWFYPIKRGFSVDIKFTARVGEAYQIDMVDPDGRLYSHKGVIKELIPHKKLVFTWNSHVVEDTLVTIRLEKAGQGTKIILTHEFKLGDQIEGHEEGWKELLENLDKLLTKV